jgi:hypothetical protein
MISDEKFMAISVFEGGNGDLVLCQEWPSLHRGERFARVMIEMKDAEKLAGQILAVARASNRK